MSKLVVKKKQGIFIIPVEDIVYMEKDLRKICLHMMRGSYRIIDFYGRFEEVIPYLDGRFMCCHRSYIINMDAIVWMRGCEIFVVTNESIHMGRDTYGKARKIFTDYLNSKYPEKTVKNPIFFL